MLALFVITKPIRLVKYRSSGFSHEQTYELASNSRLKPLLQRFSQLITYFDDSHGAVIPVTGC
jgi:hypothetical protein